MELSQECRARVSSKTHQKHTCVGVGSEIIKKVVKSDLGGFVSLSFC